MLTKEQIISDIVLLNKNKDIIKKYYNICKLYLENNEEYFYDMEDDIGYFGREDSLHGIRVFIRIKNKYNYKELLHKICFISDDELYNFIINMRSLKINKIKRNY